MKEVKTSALAIMLWGVLEEIEHQNYEHLSPVSGLTILSHLPHNTWQPLTHCLIAEENVNVGERLHHGLLEELAQEWC